MHVKATLDYGVMKKVHAKHDET